MYLADLVLGKTPGRRRSSRWPEVRAAYLDIFPECEACGRDDNVEVHHVVPFHMNPDLELEWSNLMTLCRNKKNGIHCHLYVGHRGNYRLVNPEARKDAKRIRRFLGKD